MQGWESDSDTEQKVPLKRATVAEAETEAAEDTAQPTECVDEVWYCCFLYVSVTFILIELYLSG